MRMKMQDGWLYIIEADLTQTARIKSWGLMKWKRKDKMWYGRVSGELLNRLSTLLPALPPSIEAERMKFIEKQKAVDHERTLPMNDLKPLVRFPVTRNMYAHQTRAANMALITFGVIDPKEVMHDR